MVVGPHSDWADGSSDEGEGLDREWRARREEHYSSGYREGLEAGKHETVQQGFDAGYALGAAAGFECGAARGAAATLAALAPRLPADLAGRVQEAQQQQQAQQQIAAMPFQQLQRQVCESLMAATEPAAGQQQGPALPPGVRTALSDARAVVERLGLQVPEPRHQ